MIQTVPLGLADDQLKAIRNNIFKLVNTLSKVELALLSATAGLTMLPPCRLLDAYSAAKQAAIRCPTSALVEFGVYRGGGLAAIAYGASSEGDFSGSVIGFDTFSGHTIPPLSNEFDIHGTNQLGVFEERSQLGGQWAACDVSTMRGNYHSVEAFLGVKFCEPKLVVGDARETAAQLSVLAPNGIGLLRLDMDWLEPTRAALLAAEPLLLPYSVIIFDDYGHHSGVKEVVDSFLNATQRKFDWTMTDYSCMRITLLD